MSTLKVTHLQNESNSAPSISISSAVGGGVTFAGISTFHGAVKLEDGLHGNSTNIITASTNGSERLRITSAGDVGIGDNAPNDNYGTNLSIHSTATDGARLKLSDGTTGKGNLDGLDIISTGGVAYFINRESADMSFSSGSSGSLRITSGGNVGINDASPSDALTVYKNNVGNPSGITIRNTEASSTYSHARLRLESQNGAAYGEIWADVANAGLRLGYNSSSTVKIDSTGNIVLLNGRGIDFSATSDASGMSSEILDDYEEGTWTPVINAGSVSSYTWQTGRYTKVGNLVTIWFDVKWSTASTIPASGSIGGLPFNVVANTSQGGYGAPQFRDLTGITGSDMAVYGNSSYFSNPDDIVLKSFNSSGVEQNATFGSNGRVTGHGFYYVNNAY